MGASIITPFSRLPMPFDCKGINLSTPVSLIVPGKYRVLDNVRPYGPGQVQGRQGIGQQSSSTLPAAVHSIKQMNDPTPEPSAFPGTFPPRGRFLGVGSALYSAISASGMNPSFFSQIVTGFSGNPLSMVVSRPERSNHPWCFVHDSVKMRKVATSQTPYQIGIAPPNFFPNASLNGAVPDGPISTVDTPYYHRFVARTYSDINTGAVSNPGPSVRTIDAQNTGGASMILRVTITEIHPDPQVRWLDIYRYGGALPEWIYVGSVVNTVGAFHDDPLSDEAIAGNERLAFDNFQPWLSTDASATGTCRTVAYGTGRGGLVIWETGDLFKFYGATADSPYWTAGNTISVGGTLYTFFKAPLDAVTIEVLEDPLPVSGEEFLIESPDLARVPIASVWGPFGGGQTGTFLFGCGDVRRPGTLYWTKGNNPEAVTGRGSLDLTTPAEPLMSGCIYDGRIFVWSTDRMFQIFPSFGQTSDFTAQEIPGSKGLWSRWAVATGPLIWFLGRDGIYESNGYSFINITDEDLYPLFPHEGSKSTAVRTPEGVADIGYQGVQMDHFSNLRLCYADGFLYFDYRDQGGSERTLVYDVPNRAWISRDEYDDHVIVHYAEEGEQLDHKVLIGTLGGKLADYGGTNDFGSPIEGRVRTASRDMGDPRASKFFGDVELRMDANGETITAKLGFDEYSSFTTASTFTTNGRRILELNAGVGQYGRNIGLDLSWSAVNAIPRVYAWEPSFIPKPELSSRRVTDWTDDGYGGAKFVQGFILRADTLSQSRTVNVQKDGGALAETITIQHIGEVEKPYAFTTPFITHMLRFHPSDSNFWRVMGLRWIWEPVPEAVTVWETQETTHDLKGWGYHRDSYITLMSDDVVTLVVTVGSVEFTYLVASTSGLPDKVYVPLQPMKFRYVKYRLTSPCPFRLFKKDSEVRVKAWGGPGPFVSKLPFGDYSRIEGARI